MKIKWFGHAHFMITLDDLTTIVTDPFDASVGYNCPRLYVDILTISHSHFDHACMDNIAKAEHIVKEAGTYELGNVRVTGIMSAHDDEGGAKRGANIIFKIEAEGKSVVHLGDLGHLPTPEQYEFIQNADALLIPIGGYYTIDTDQAIEIIKCAAPKLTIPMHYKTAPVKFPIHDSCVFTQLTKASFYPCNEVELTPDLPKVLLLDY